MFYVTGEKNDKSFRTKIGQPWIHWIWWAEWESSIRHFTRHSLHLRVVSSKRLIHNEGFQCENQCAERCGLQRCRHYWWVDLCFFLFSPRKPVRLIGQAGYYSQLNRQFMRKWIYLELICRNKNKYKKIRWKAAIVSNRHVYKISNFCLAGIGKTCCWFYRWVENSLYFPWKWLLQLRRTRLKHPELICRALEALPIRPTNTRLVINSHLANRRNDLDVAFFYCNETIVNLDGNISISEFRTFEHLNIAQCWSNIAVIKHLWWWS